MLQVKLFQVDENAMNEFLWARSADAIRYFVAVPLRDGSNGILVAYEADRQTVTVRPSVRAAP